jgi:histidine ammonia-lyase
MGPIAARKLASVVRNVAGVLAIEAVTAARAIDLREQPTSAPLQLVHSAIRRHVRPHEGDRSYTDEFEALTNAILRGELREACQVPGLNFSESRC